MKDLFIEGNAVNLGRVQRRRVGISADTGLINFVGEPKGRADLMLNDELIFAGFIDLHVHARECADHSQDYKEDFVSAGEAAINGGVVAFLDMPNNPTPPVDKESYLKKCRLKEKSPADVFLYAGIGAGTKPLKAMVPYKVFMGPSVGDLFFKTNSELEGVIKNYRGQNISFHCEDPEILEKHKFELTHEFKRPKEAENLAIDFALKLIEKYNLIGKICHCSTVSGMQKIVAAKKQGLSVTVEITPHHLFFDTDMLNEKNHRALQVNPPIRHGRTERLKLIKMLKQGDIDYLATDHAPHTIGEKEKGASGLPHLDTYGSFAAWLMKEHNFTPMEIARVCSYNPAKFLKPFLSEGFGKGYGEIAEGFTGSLTILNINRPVKISKAILKTKCKWSPFENTTFPGRATHAVVQGKLYKVD